MRFIEKYNRTTGGAKDGLYCYNFCLNTSPFEYQPSGAVNAGRFKNIEFEFTTYLPPIDTDGATVNLQRRITAPADFQLNVSAPVTVDFPSRLALPDDELHVVFCDLLS